MIKILPNGSSASIKTSNRRKSASGQLGDGVKQGDFSLGSIKLSAKWEDRLLSAEISAEDDVYVETLGLSFKYKSPKAPAETVIWTEALSDGYPLGNKNGVPGVEDRKQNRSGAWAMWFGEAADSDGLFLGQDPPANMLTTFTCRPSAHSFTVTWILNRRLNSGEKLALSEIKLRRGPRRPAIDTWRRKWTGLSSRSLPADRRRGWLADREIASPRDLRESAAVARAAKLGLDWFAIGPNFASATGDWLQPNDDFNDRMGSASRSIAEAGFIPGLRFAPFLVSRNSNLAAEHRDWLLSSEGGSPLTVSGYPESKESAYVLDATNSKVQDHLRRMFTIMRDRWGYRVFVLERFADLAQPGHRQNDRICAGTLLLDAGQLIRGALGEKVLLVGMNVPLLPTAGVWDIQTQTPAPRQSAKPGDLSQIASGLIHRSAWNEGTWINAAGPLPATLFVDKGRSAEFSLRQAVSLSSGAVIFCGDLRSLDDESQSAMKEMLDLFEECRKGSLNIGGELGGGRREPLVVRNDRGWIALFNFSKKRREASLEKDDLRSSHGVTASLSAGDGAVFNSPEIRVALPPWGQRLFRG